MKLKKALTMLLGATALTLPMAMPAFGYEAGSGASASVTASTAVGDGAKAVGEDSTAVGDGATADGIRSTAVGGAANAKIRATAVGGNAQATGNDSTAVGNNSSAEGKETTSIGASAGGTGEKGVYVGKNAGNGSVGDRNVVVGAEKTGVGMKGNLNTTMGNNSQFNTEGSENSSYGAYAGQRSKGDNNTAIGAQSGRDVIGDNNVSLGYDSNSGIKASNTTAIGTDSRSTGESGVALGFGAQNEVEGGVALGSGSVADRGAGEVGYGAPSDRGDDSVWESTQGAVSIGKTGETRQLTNLAAGTEDSDGVNVAQLKSVEEIATEALAAADNGWELSSDGNSTTTDLNADIGGNLGVKGDSVFSGSVDISGPTKITNTLDVAVGQTTLDVNGSSFNVQVGTGANSGKLNVTSSSVSLTSNGSGFSTSNGTASLTGTTSSIITGGGSNLSVTSSGVNLSGAGGAPLRLSGVADPVSATDAVNLRTMQREIGSLEREIGSLETEMSAGIAQSMAMTQLPYPDLDKNFSLGGAVGHFNGKMGMAVGGAARLDGHTMLRGAASYSSAGGLGVAAGVGWSW